MGKKGAECNLNWEKRELGSGRFTNIVTLALTNLRKPESRGLRITSRGFRSRPPETRIPFQSTFLGVLPLPNIHVVDILWISPWVDMPMTMHINLSDEMERYIKSKVATGFYGSATEVIRDAIRRMQASDAQLGAPSATPPAAMAPD
jgi:putative addiction module CopG family antidote